MRTADERRFLGKFCVGDDCWLWTAGQFWNGYGNFRVEGKHLKAHRVSYELFVGAIPPQLCVCHHCDEPSCVRPSHLFLGTHADNMRDREAKRRNRPKHGEANGYSKLTEPLVHEIRRRHKAGHSGRSIARELGLNRYTVGDVLRGRTWGHVKDAAP